MAYPDDGFRLLALYRYWNMIQYYFPYKYLTDKNWNDVLKEYISIFIDADNELEYEMASIQLITEIGDSHADLGKTVDKFEKRKGKNHPPFHLRFIENQLTIVDYYNDELKSSTDLKVGDVILKINGKPIEKIIKKKEKFYPASNKAIRLVDMANDLLRSNERHIEVEYISHSQKKKLTSLTLYPKDSLNFYKRHKPINEKSYKLLDNNIGYITLQTIKKADLEIIKKEFKKTKGIIIDIRNYPATTSITFPLGAYFTSTPKPFFKWTAGSVDNPGTFNFLKTYKLPSDGNIYSGKLVVIVDETSLSNAEFTAMALRAGDNTTIIGNSTAGADGNTSSISLPGNIRTRISGVGIYYPDEKETQRVGITPDIIVKPTIKDIRAGKDQMLEKAIEIISKA